MFIIFYNILSYQWLLVVCFPKIPDIPNVTGCCRTCSKLLADAQQGVLPVAAVGNQDRRVCASAQYTRFLHVSTCSVHAILILTYTYILRGTYNTKFFGTLGHILKLTKIYPVRIIASEKVQQKLDSTDGFPIMGHKMAGGAVSSLHRGFVPKTS